MKGRLMILISVVSVTTLYGQITTTKVVPALEPIDNTPYDSTENFLGLSVYKYLGQDLYLNHKSESMRKHGYQGFSIDYTKSTLGNKSNVYKCCDSHYSKYEELAGKYFTVMEVVRHPQAIENKLYSKKFYLKLQEKESGDVMYYEYDGQFENSFPFVVVGFFMKLKTTEVGKEFIIRGKNWRSSGPMTDISTGKPVSNFEVGAKWKCVDVTIEEKYYSVSLVLENENGELIPIGVDNSKRTNWIFNLEQANLYKKKFGDEDWQLILNGKVKVGMTKEMCELSWGKPKSINETITSGRTSEQWVYLDNYLYFDNGVVTTMQ